MNILIAGGSGFLGSALTKSFLADGHKVFILTRTAKKIKNVESILWDGKTLNTWVERINEMDVVIHLTGKSLATFPWTRATKQSFLDSRLNTGLLLASAIQASGNRPSVFVQASGINYYGLSGSLADESTPPADDFLAQLAVKWEDATKSLDDLGVRRIVVRSAVVLDKKGSLLDLMALPIKLFFGGKLGSGQQAFPWIHIKDWVGAVRFLIAHEKARGAYNLIAPAQISNIEFNQTLAKVLKRPFWFHVPQFLIRNILGEMSVLILDGRFAQPKRLIESGYQFQFPNLKEALDDLMN
ncbi:MAG: NAD-dependent epimerase/dehydratase family protein [Chloroflexi bacterium OLB14]|nr:MAG: NAD-dependent epimerase/dehydratase family protein [Chloroflexi bacterium OLB14]